MHPILFKIGNITVYSYGVMLALGFIIATFLLTKEANRQSIHKDFVVDLAFLLIISGLVGARIAYAFLNLGYFFNHPLEIFMVNRGGLVWYGGLIFSAAALFIFTKSKRQDFLVIADLVSPYVALAHAIGRVGCFFRGCCYGKSTESIFGVYFKAYNATLFPTQLIESFLLIVIFVILRLSSNKIRFKGGLFFLYLMLYSLARFSVEFLRGDSYISFFGLSPFQLFSVPIFILSLFLFYKTRSTLKVE